MSVYGYTVKYMGKWYEPGEDVPDDVPTKAVPAKEVDEEKEAIAEIIKKDPPKPRKPKGRPKKA